MNGIRVLLFWGVLCRLVHDCCGRPIVRMCVRMWCVSSEARGWLGCEMGWVCTASRNPVAHSGVTHGLCGA